MCLCVLEWWSVHIYSAPPSRWSSKWWTSMWAMEPNTECSVGLQIYVVINVLLLHFSVQCVLLGTVCRMSECLLRLWLPVCLMLRCHYLKNDAILRCWLLLTGNRKTHPASEALRSFKVIYEISFIAITGFPLFWKVLYFEFGHRCWKSPEFG